jgi:hypothetical protein
VSYRSMAYRVLIIAATVLAAAINGGWKWGVPH